MKSTGMRISTTIGLVLTLALLTLVGCGNQDEQSKNIVVKGRVTSIEPKNGKVKMFGAREGKMEREFEGVLAPNAEILINGKTARLADVQVDDRAEVNGRIEKRDGDQNFIADKVVIHRPINATNASVNESGK